MNIKYDILSSKQKYDKLESSWTFSADFASSLIFWLKKFFLTISRQILSKNIENLRIYLLAMISLKKFFLLKTIYCLLNINRKIFDILCILFLIFCRFFSLKGLIFKTTFNRLFSYLKCGKSSFLSIIDF